MSYGFTREEIAEIVARHLEGADRSRVTSVIDNKVLEELGVRANPSQKKISANRHTINDSPIYGTCSGKHLRPNSPAHGPLSEAVFYNQGYYEGQKGRSASDIAKEVIRSVYPGLK